MIPHQRLRRRLSKIFTIADVLSSIFEMSSREIQKLGCIQRWSILYVYSSKQPSTLNLGEFFTNTSNEKLIGEEVSLLKGIKEVALTGKVTSCL